ncbi:MAG: GIY-YIG nuclease family protein [Bacteroidetes bacterium]|nr:GIY-YIG nuclease family protein [Bacteroidota bacterium]MBP9796641.1 GIY-YIG nuclease family protein [Chitinophagales bacterium]
MNNEIYVGNLTDTERRLKEHNSGKNRCTKAFIPCSILFIELCEGFEAARKREIYFKSFRVGRWDYP